MTSSDTFRKQLEGFGLTTADVFYHLPSHPHVLNEFIWQFEDLYPEFPRLKKFLGFWKVNIEGPIHSVTIAHHRLIKPTEIKLVDREFYLH